MRGVVDQKVKAECIRLRVQERQSLREIAKATGVAKGTLSAWLKPHPLSKDERQTRQQFPLRYRAPPKSRGAESALHQMQPGELSRLEKAKVAEAATLLRLVLHHMVPFGSVFDGDKADWSWRFLEHDVSSSCK